MCALWKRKPKTPPPPEIVFASADGKARRIAATAPPAGARLVVACAFEAGRRDLESRLAAAGLRTERAARAADLARTSAVPALTTTRVLEEAAGARLLRVPPLRVIVAERHPLRVHDDAVVEWVRARGDGSEVSFVLSLQDPLFVRLGGDLERIVAALGLGPDEPIEHAMVSRAIEAAQEKLARRLKQDLPADSAEEWFSRNR